MQGLMEIKQGALSFHVENSIAIIHKQGKYTSQNIIDFMGFSTINIHCNVIYGVKDIGKDTDILYTFTLTEPPSYLIYTLTNNVLYQNEKNIE